MDGSQRRSEICPQSAEHGGKVGNAVTWILKKEEVPFIKNKCSCSNKQPQIPVAFRNGHVFVQG